MRELKIGMLQLHNTADIQKNIENLIEGIKDLANRGAELVVLQELPQLALLLSGRRCRQLQSCRALFPDHQRKSMVRWQENAE